MGKKTVSHTELVARELSNYVCIGLCIRCQKYVLGVRHDVNSTCEEKNQHMENA